MVQLLTVRRPPVLERSGFFPTGNLNVLLTCVLVQQILINICSNNVTSKIEAGNIESDIISRTCSNIFDPVVGVMGFRSGKDQAEVGGDSVSFSTSSEESSSSESSEEEQPPSEEEIKKERIAVEKKRIEDEIKEIDEDLKRFEENVHRVKGNMPRTNFALVSPTKGTGKTTVAPLLANILLDAKLRTGGVNMFPDAATLLAKNNTTWDDSNFTNSSNSKNIFTNSSSSNKSNSRRESINNNYSSNNQAGGGRSFRSKKEATQSFLLQANYEQTKAELIKKGENELAEKIDTIRNEKNMVKRQRMVKEHFVAEAKKRHIDYDQKRREISARDETIFLDLTREQYDDLKQHMRISRHVSDDETINAAKRAERHAHEDFGDISTSYDASGALVTNSTSNSTGNFFAKGQRCTGVGKRCSLPGAQLSREACERHSYAVMSENLADQEEELDRIEALENERKGEGEAKYTIESNVVRTKLQVQYGRGNISRDTRIKLFAAPPSHDLSASRKKGDNGNTSNYDNRYLTNPFTPKRDFEVFDLYEECSWDGMAARFASPQSPKDIRFGDPFYFIPKKRDSSISERFGLSATASARKIKPGNPEKNVEQYYTAFSGEENIGKSWFEDMNHALYHPNPWYVESVGARASLAVSLGLQIGDRFKGGFDSPYLVHKHVGEWDEKIGRTKKKTIIGSNKNSSRRTTSIKLKHPVPCNINEKSKKSKQSSTNITTTDSGCANDGAWDNLRFPISIDLRSFDELKERFPSPVTSAGFTSNNSTDKIRLEFARKKVDVENNFSTLMKAANEKPDGVVVIDEAGEISSNFQGKYRESRADAVTNISREMLLLTKRSNDELRREKENFLNSTKNINDVAVGLSKNSSREVTEVEAEKQNHHHESLSFTSDSNFANEQYSNSNNSSASIYSRTSVFDGSSKALPAQPPSLILTGDAEHFEEGLFKDNLALKEQFEIIELEGYSETELLEIWGLELKKKEFTDGSKNRCLGKFIVNNILTASTNKSGNKTSNYSTAVGVCPLAGASAIKSEIQKMIQKRIYLNNIRKFRTEFSLENSTNGAVLTMEDALGPNPATSQKLKALREKLETFSGWKQQKEEVDSIINVVITNYENTLNYCQSAETTTLTPTTARSQPIQLELNRLMLGNPGTGKTTFAGIFAQILGELNILSVGTVKDVKTSELMGEHVGESKTKTQSILNAHKGKVLFIDEAYQLARKVNGKVNLPGQEVLDTIVENLSGNTLADDVVVLMAGYGDEVLEMIQGSNPGLRRRFDPNNAFLFKDYTIDELMAQLRKKCKNSRTEPSELFLEKARAFLVSEKRKPNFGNAGTINTLFNNAQKRAEKRITDNKKLLLGNITTASHTKNKSSAGGTSTWHAYSNRIQEVVEEDGGNDDIDTTILNTTACTRHDGIKSRINSEELLLLEEDLVFDAWTDPTKISTNTSNLDDEFSFFDKMVGMEEIKQRFIEKKMNYLYDLEAGCTNTIDEKESAEALRFVFQGESGTGKTEVAKASGKMLFDAGLIDSERYTLVSASALIGQYVGHSAPKVEKLFSDNLGGTVIIDEAHFLGNANNGSTNSFKEEAITTILSKLTDPAYTRTLVIFAGYKTNMENFLSSNIGLRSRISDFFDFPNFNASTCTQYFKNLVHKNNFKLSNNKIQEMEKLTKKFWTKVVKDMGVLGEEHGGSLFENGKTVEKFFLRVKSEKIKRKYRNSSNSSNTNSTLNDPRTKYLLRGSGRATSINSRSRSSSTTNDIEKTAGEEIIVEEEVTAEDLNSITMADLNNAIQKFYKEVLLVSSSSCDSNSTNKKQSSAVDNSTIVGAQEAAFPEAEYYISPLTTAATVAPSQTQEDCSSQAEEEEEEEEEQSLVSEKTNEGIVDFVETNESACSADESANVVLSGDEDSMFGTDAIKENHSHNRHDHQGKIKTSSCESHDHSHDVVDEEEQHHDHGYCNHRHQQGTSEEKKLVEELRERRKGIEAEDERKLMEFQAARKKKMEELAENEKIKKKIEYENKKKEEELKRKIEEKRLAAEEAAEKAEKKRIKAMLAARLMEEKKELERQLEQKKLEAEKLRKQKEAEEERLREELQALQKQQQEEEKRKQDRIDYENKAQAMIKKQIRNGNWSCDWGYEWIPDGEGDWICEKGVCRISKSVMDAWLSGGKKL